MRIGITGHQELDEPLQWEGVRERLRAILSANTTPLVGITCLAVGADQVFAQAVLDEGGSIEAIIPFSDYETKFDDSAAKDTYRRLLAQATRVEILPRAGSDEESYFAAGKRVVELADMMVAVWDGKPAEGLGGTADVVRYTQEVRKHVVAINPHSL